MFYDGPAQMSNASESHPPKSVIRDSTQEFAPFRKKIRVEAMHCLLAGTECLRAMSRRV